MRVPARIWVRRAFLTWALVSTGWMANSMRTRGVADEVLRTAVDRDATLEFIPRGSAMTGLIFICGGGVAAQAYAPLLRPIADSGHAVIIVKLPFRFAPYPSHKDEAVRRVHAAISEHREVTRWVVAGHSLGGAMAARVAQSKPAAVSALVLIGTTHPKEANLSSLTIPVTKVYGSNDGVAPVDRILANKHLLPAHTKWVEIRGGNHSQFGHYGHQLLDGRAAISRDAQQAMTRTAIADTLSP